MLTTAESKTLATPAETEGDTASSFVAYTTMGQRYTPIEKAGVYVPGGTASYLSTVLMGRALREAAAIDPRRAGAVPSTKGTLL